MRVRWTTPAVDDFTNICDYTEQGFGSPQARRVALTIFDAANSLAVTPYKGRKGRRSSTRELLVSNLPFVIIYRVSEPIIEIVRILHGAQKWP